MGTWPALPSHGEFVVLPLGCRPSCSPPWATTATPATSPCGTAATTSWWATGPRLRTGRWFGFEVFWHHDLIQAPLGPYSLLAPDHDPYLDPPHRLLADRWERTPAVGESADVAAFVASQPNRLAELTEGMEPEAVGDLVRQVLQRPGVDLDVDDVMRSMAAAARSRPSGRLARRAPRRAAHSRAVTRPPPDRADPPPLGKCRFCGEDSWRSDEGGPAHPCCAIHARESPGRPCPACEASRNARRRH